MIDKTESIKGKYLKKQNSFEEKCEASKAVSINDNDEQRTDTQLCVIRIYRNYKISFNKFLIPLRMALFFWFGAAEAPMAYLFVFMKQKGLSLVEFSSTLSVTFIFQFLTAFLSGIIADKIGNAKPVLIFHLLITILSILSLLLIPGIDNNCDFKNDDKIQGYTDENVTRVAIKFEEMNTTFPQSIAKIIFSERNVLDNHSVPVSSFANITGQTSGKDTENCTSSQVPAKNICGTHQTAFLILHIITTAIFLSSWSATFRFMDVAVMSLVEKCDTSYGYERIFSVSGNLVLTFITGVILNSFSSETKKINYPSVYWFSLTMMCFALLAISNVKSKVKLSGENMWREGFILLKNTDNLVFITVIFMLGTLGCFFENFILLFLEHINASPIVMGLQQMIIALYFLPIFFTAKWWLNIFGPKKLFILAFLGYSVYGVGYSFLYNPWLCLLIEASSSVTYHLLWVAVVTHSYQIAPDKLVSTVIATTGSIYFAIGRSSGSVVGGFLMNAVGSRITFRILAGMSSIAAVLYATFLYFRKPTENVQQSPTS